MAEAVSTVVEICSILGSSRCARLGHWSSRVGLEEDENDGCPGSGYAGPVRVWRMLMAAMERRGRPVPRRAR